MSFINKTLNKLSFPFIKQANMMECGTTSLAIIFKYHGLSNYRHILNQLAEISQEGTSLYVLDQIAEKFGFEGEGYQMDFDHLNKIQLPCIAHYEGNHFVVVYDVGEDYVKISDPAVGKYKQSKFDFLKKWNGIILEIKPTDNILKNKDIVEYIEIKKKERKNVIKSFYGSIFLGIKKNLIQILSASLILQIIGLLFPLFTQVIIDKVLPQQNSKLLLIILFALIVVVGTQVLLTYVRNILLSQFKIKSEFEFFRRFFDHFIRLKQKYFDLTHREDLMNRFKENLRLRMALSPSIFERIIGIPLLIVYFIILFLYNTNLGLIAFIYFIVYSAVVYFVTPKLVFYTNRIFNENGKVVGQFLDSLLGVQTIKLLGAEFAQSFKFRNFYKRNLNKVLELEKFTTKIMTVLRALGFLGQTLIYWIGAYYAFNGELSIGQYIAFITIFGIVLMQINNITLIWFMFSDLSVTILKFNDVMVQPAEEFDIIEKRNSFQNYDIKFKNVSFSYNENEKEYVLKNINLEIKYGEFIGIVGKNGSGKSTFVKLLSNLYNTTEGIITIGGIDKTDYDLHQYRKKVFMLAQHTDIFNTTIRENISYGSIRTEIEDIIEASKQADFHEFVKSLHLGYNYKVGDVGGRLSGGQKLKLAFARLFLKDPEIIILDEASSALDAESEHIIMKNLKERFKNKTIISIAHRFTTLKNADRIIVFDNGNIAEIGKHEELLKNKNIYYNLIKNHLNF